MTTKQPVVIEEIVVDIYGDRWVKFAHSPFYKNADQDDDRLTRHDLSDRYGPLTPYRQEPEPSVMVARYIADCRPGQPVTVQQVEL